MAETKEPLITFEQSEAVVKFAQALYAYDRYGAWSPWMSNELLRNLNYNGRPVNSDKIREALTKAQSDPGVVQDYMQFMKTFDMIFARTLKSYANALSFDVVPVCNNIYTKDEYESKEYLADKKRMEDFLIRFDYRKEFRNVVENVLTNEVYYTWFRKVKWKNKGMKYALQILPQKECMMTGYWEKGILFDFNMAYFLNPGVDIDAYDPAFKKYFNRVFGDNETIENYRPTNPLAKRDGTYALWTQTSPVDGSWCWKFSTDNFNETPFLAPFLKNAINNDEIQELQYDKDVAEAYGILAGEIATFESAKSGTQTDQMVFKPETLAGFMRNAKRGLSNRIKLAALPVKNLDFYQFEDKNADMYSNQIATSAGVGTGISRVIYSSDRMSSAEIEAALNEVYETMKPLYAQFSNFLEFYVGQITKKYKWSFIFPNGCTYPHKRKEYFDNLTKMADKGLVPPPAMWASSVNTTPVLFERMLEESKYTGWLDKYSQLMANVNTASFNRTSGNQGGRPKVDDGDLSDSGEMNRNQ